MDGVEWLFEITSFDASGEVYAKAEVWLASPDYGSSWGAVEWSVLPGGAPLPKEDAIRMALRSHAVHISRSMGLLAQTARQMKSP